MECVLLLLWESYCARKPTAQLVGVENSIHMYNKEIGNLKCNIGIYKGTETRLGHRHVMIYISTIMAT